MKYLARAILTAAILSLLAAIWIGPWWAWLLTALILLFVGAGLSGSNVPDEPHPIDRGLLPEDVAREFVEPSTLEQNDKNHPTYGKPAQKENDR